MSDADGYEGGWTEIYEDHQAAQTDWGGFGLDDLGDAPQRAGYELRNVRGQGVVSQAARVFGRFLAPPAWDEKAPKVTIVQAPAPPANQIPPVAVYGGLALLAYLALRRK